MNVIDSFINWATRILSYISASVLFCMMVLTTFDVITRYFFNAPIIGVVEITEFMMVSLIFLSLAFAQKLKGHVAVDILVGRFQKKRQHLFNIFNYLVSMIFLILIALMSGVRGFETFHDNQVSGDLGIPVYPFYFLLTIGCASMALELLKDLITSIRDRVIQ